MVGGLGPTGPPLKSGPATVVKVMSIKVEKNSCKSLTNFIN